MDEKLKPKYEEIIYKIDAEGLDYWLSDYAMPSIIAEFDPVLAAKVVRAKDAMSVLEIATMKIKKEYQIGEI